MGRPAKVQKSAEEKFAIVMEALKGGNLAETCRTHGISPALMYRWRDEMEKGALAALGGRSAANARPDEEQARRIKQLERALGRSHLQIEILKNVLGE